MLPDAPRKKAQLLSLPFEAFIVQPLPDSASLRAMRSPPPASGPLTERGPVLTSRPGWLPSCLHSASLTPRPQGSPPDSRRPPCPPHSAELPGADGRRWGCSGIQPHEPRLLPCRVPPRLDSEPGAAGASQPTAGRGTHVYVVGVDVVGVGIAQHRVQFDSVPIIWKHRARGHGAGRG